MPTCGHGHPKYPDACASPSQGNTRWAGWPELADAGLAGAMVLRAEWAGKLVIVPPFKVNGPALFLSLTYPVNA